MTRWQRKHDKPLNVMRKCDECGDLAEQGYDHRLRTRARAKSAATYRDVWLCDTCFEDAVRRELREDESPTQPVRRKSGKPKWKQE